MSEDAKKILDALQSGALPAIKESKTKGKEGLIKVRYNKDGKTPNFSVLSEDAASYSKGAPINENVGNKQGKGNKSNVLVRENTARKKKTDAG